MSSIVQDAYTQAANAIEAAIIAEFDDIQYLDIHHDKIHDSLGADGVCHVGIYPEDVSPSRYATNEVSLTIQWYNPYDATVDPFQEVDPRPVANQAERLTRALARARSVNTRQTWFFTVGTVRFTPDPTGNKSRFDMSVSTVGDDMGLMETIG